MHPKGAETYIAILQIAVSFPFLQQKKIEHVIITSSHILTNF